MTNAFGSSPSSLSPRLSSWIPTKRRRLARLALPWLGLALALGENGAAQTRTATSTALTVTAGGSAVTSAAAGTMVTLTATVKAGTTALKTGQVNFCDATAKYCTDVHVLGMAQLTSAGTATLKLRPGIGSHTYKAVFLGTNIDAGSSSASSAALTVTGKYATTTTITQGGTIGSYTLTATVSSSATTLPGPTGQVSLIDTTSGNAVLATQALGSATLGATLVNASNPAVGNGPTGIVAGDFNGDGNLDLAVGLNDPSQPLTIMLGDGTGNFTAAPASSITVTGTPVLVQDFNGDGIPDILLSDELGGSATVLLGNGDGTFRLAPGGPITTNYGSYPAFAADFNGDGIPDLALGGGYYLVVLLGNGDGSFTQVPVGSSSIGGEDQLSSMVLGDFNGDGIPDVAMVNGSISIFLGKGDGTFTAGTTVTPSAGSPVALATADFNGDGKLDLAVIVGNNGNFSVEFFPGNGDGTFGAALSSPTTLDVSPFIFGVGDFNGDGNADLFLGAQTSGTTISILLGGANGTFTQMPTGSASLPCCSNSVLGDFNNTGLTGIASSDVYDGIVQLLVPQVLQASITASNINPPGPGTQQVDASYPGDSHFSSNVSGTTSLTPSLANVQISPAPGTYTTAQTIKLTEATPGATIYYNASGIVNAGYVAYTGPIQLNTGGTETIGYYATETGYAGSNEVFANYVMNLPLAPSPTFSLAAGSYSGSQSLSISDSVTGASIYYTTDGTLPGTYSTPYTGKISISSSEVVTAVAIATGYTLSAPTSAQYLIASSSTPYIYTVAGTKGVGFSGDGGPATLALLNHSSSVKEDSQGNLYIADQGNNVIRKVTASTGIITTVAGTGIPGYSGDNGAAASAELNTPAAIAFDSAGNLYIADLNNNVVRKVTTTTGIITTVAGNGTYGESGDSGPATSAEMSNPAGVVIDSAGDLYISDSQAGLVRKVTASTGTITTYAGGGSNLAYNSIGDGGPATSAQLEGPQGLALDSKGNLYIADSEDEVIREVNVTTGIISTVAGSYAGIGDGAYLGDGGPATSAKLYTPMDVAVDSASNLYIADLYNSAIRKVTASTGDIATLAGDGSPCYGSGGDGGPAADAYLCNPAGVSIDASGNLYLAEEFGRVRKVTPSMQPPATATATPTFSVKGGSYAGPQTVTLSDATPGTEIYLTLDGTTPSTGGEGYRAPINVNGSVTLKAVAVAPGYLPSATATAAYTISTVPPTVVSTVAGNGTNLPSSAGQAATATALDYPLDVAVDTAGNLYIADSSNNVVWKVAAATGKATVFAGTLQSPGYSGDGGPATSAQLRYPNHVALDQAGNLYISDGGNELVRMVTAATGIITTYAGTTASGSSIGDGGPATSAHLSPQGLALDSAGDLYIADTLNARVRLVNAATGNITTVAGGGSSPGSSQGDGGPATSASLSDPWDVALDSLGNLYIADISASRVRKVAAGTGIITTVAGNGDRGSSGDGLPATQAESVPFGLAVDAAGDLFIANDSVVRELAAGATTLTTFAGSGFTGFSGDGGSATLANFCNLDGMAVDAAGNLYVTDQCNYRIRKVTYSNTVATPTFNVSQGTYASSQSIEIASATKDAVIYYTTDGSTPTPHSTVYTSAITVTQTETIKAIAVAGGYSNSPIAAATYTIGLVTPTVTVTPSASSITTAQSLTVSVTVSGGTGNPVPTGAVTLTSGTYSVQQNLASGSTAFSIDAGTLPVGTDTLKATYAPDSASSGTYVTATQSSTVSVSPPLGSGVATVSVTPTLTKLTNAQAETVAVAVSGGSGQPTPTGSAILSVGTWSDQQSLSNGSATFTVPSGTLSVGTDTLTAAYSGDVNYAVASGTATVTVSQILSSGQTPSPVSPGSSATSTITFSAGTTYSGTLNLTCALTTSPNGAQSLPTCSMSPTSVTLTSGGSGTSTLTVGTTAASTTALLHPFSAPLRWLSGGGATLAALLLFGIPARRRRWASLFPLLLAIVAFGAIGCGGGGSGGGGGGGQTTPATTAGNYTFTVTGTDSVNAQITTSTTVVVTVQ